MSKTELYEIDIDKAKLVSVILVVISLFVFTLTYASFHMMFLEPLSEMTHPIFVGLSIIGLAMFPLRWFYFGLITKLMKLWMN